MDQTFSIRNLRKLLNEDRERGGHLEESYIPEAYTLRLRMFKLKKILSLSRYRMICGKMTEAAYTKRKSRIDTILETKKNEYEVFVTDALNSASKTIGNKEFRVSVTLLPTTVGGKKVYGIGKSLAGC